MDTHYKMAGEVVPGDIVFSEDGAPLKIKRVERGMTIGGVCFFHALGHSELHRSIRVEVKPPASNPPAA